MRKLKTTETLDRVHKALAQAEREGDEQLFNHAETVLSAVAFRLRNPVMLVPPEVGQSIDILTIRAKKEL